MQARDRTASIISRDNRECLVVRAAVAVKAPMQLIFSSLVKASLLGHIISGQGPR